MTIFRAIFCGVFCAMVSLPAWSASSIQAVVHQDTPEVINTTASVPSATKSRTVEIGGIILDYKTREPVPYANIVLVNPDGSMISNAGCQTDIDGKFSGKFNNVPTNAMMRVSFVGYQTLTLSPSSNAQIKLQPTATAPQEVSVVDDNDTALGATSETSGKDAEQNSVSESAQPQNVKPQDNSKQIADAEKAYNDARERENSLENRMLGGLTMAATGIGGMQLAQGLAEQNADKKAEQDMAAYLATFQCKVGDNGGRSYSGGEMGIEVAGTNQLTGLYQQYVDLAADLRERKNAMGMAPGIESQVIMDKANMGLYDAEGGKGIENGTYASLYRASRGNETDANKLTDQQNTSATRVKGGAIAAGVGAVGGIVGNVLINGGDDDKKVTEADCKKVKGTYKDGKCTCPGKDKVYKDGKCVDKNETAKNLLNKAGELYKSTGGIRSSVATIGLESQGVPSGLASTISSTGVNLSNGAADAGVSALSGIIK